MVCGVLSGFSDFTNMSYYLKKREAELSVEFGLSEGVPSHDVFSDVFRVIDIEKFMALFVEWTKNLTLAKTGQHVAIDGKAVRAATKKAENGNIPYVLSAFMCGCGISIGQKAGQSLKNRDFFLTPFNLYFFYNYSAGMISNTSFLNS